jgi:chromosome segregation ATPase
MGPIPQTQQIRDLQRRKEQLEAQLRRCHAAAQQSRAPNPSLGREVDDTSSVLARVRKELAQLAKH